MQAVLNAAVPIFALILTGFLCARFGGFDRSATDNLNRFAVYLALPALMFLAMSKITPDQIRQFGFALTFAGGIAVTFAIGFGLSRLRGRAVANSSIEGLDAGYSNVGFMGIPLCLLVFGQASVPAAIIATLFTACILFLFAIVLIEVDVHKGASLVRTVGKVCLSLVRNPLLIAPIAGLLVGLSGIILPAPLERFASLLGGAASPCALVCIGLFLAQERVVSGDATSIAALVLLKLLVQPAVTGLFAFYVFEVPSLWARSAVLLSALPIGSGPFTIAKLYGLEAGVTSGAILISHVFSVVTVSLLVAWLA
ncbi:MAG TPA: AEC family transporter [Beijerinckiaceae bacterium]|jgi:predicted permease|nr:AEC family transporter [Beijerinckiaceae bacterium]